MLLDLEQSFEELKDLKIAKFLVLPINSTLDKFESKISKMKFPVWIKLNSSEHKLSLGAVKKASSYQELEKIHLEFKKKFPDKKFIIQENISGTHIIVGIKHDKTFGKILLIGAGGSSVEEKKDIEFRVLPLTKEEISQVLSQLKVYKTIENLALTNLVDLIEKISKLKIVDADINPVIVNDKDAFIVDSRLEIEQD